MEKKKKGRKVRVKKNGEKSQRKTSGLEKYGRKYRVEVKDQKK